MKIAMIAPFEESVPPQKYGGTEVVVYNLITELHRLGHEIILYGTGDSNVPCKLISIFDRSIRTQEPFASDHKSREMAKFGGISKVISYLQKENFDIIHNHIGWRFSMFSHLFSPPVVTTLHGPPGEINHHFIWKEFPKDLFVSISDNQRKGYPELPYVGTVYNGIDLSFYEFDDVLDGDYFLFLARFSPEKGAREAIEIANRAGKKLVMAVKIDSIDKMYYESVAPLIKSGQVEFVGEVGGEAKVRLLKNATALLAPIQWEEPFGLFVVEAMACGTPVVGMKRGSFPELINHGKNGFLAETVEEAAYYAKQVGSIDRKVCRQSVEEKFTKEKMAEGYLKIYEKIIAG